MQRDADQRGPEPQGLYDPQFEKDAKLGAQVGTTSYNAIVDLIQPSQDPAVYDRNDDAIRAMQNKQIDGIVVDFPSTGYITGVQVPNATVVVYVRRMSVSPAIWPGFGGPPRVSSSMML